MFTVMCNKSAIRVIGDDVVASGTQKIISVKFCFSDDWDGVATKIAQFSNNKDECISVPIGESFEVEVPWEVLSTPKLPVFVGVYGIGADGARLPTVWGVLCYVSLGVPRLGTEGREPTQDYFDRLEEIVEESKRVGKSAYEIAVDNGFVGTEVEWLASLNGTDGINGTDGTNGRDGADGRDGRDGRDGANGNDGLSPTISIVQIANGHRITVTDKDGANAFDVLNGANGKDGENGRDGIDGKDGVDGANGTNGADGFSPSITISTIEGGHRVAVTDKNGTNTFDVLNGTDGTPADISGKLDKSEFTAFQIDLGVIMQGMEQQMYNPLAERVGTLEDKVGDGFDPVDISGKLDKSEFTTFQTDVTTRLTAVETNKVDKTENEVRWSNLELLFQALDQQILTPLSNRVTAIEGADYLTQADQQAIVEAVISALPDASEVSY